MKVRMAIKIDHAAGHVVVKGNSVKEIKSWEDSCKNIFGDDITFKNVVARNVEDAYKRCGTSL